MWILILTGLASFTYLLILFLLKNGVERWEKTPELQEETNIPVSVVIAARNEASNLSRYLLSFLTQDYPNYEVWVVLDRCEDHSLEIVKQLKDKYSQLNYLEIKELPDNWSGKKWALSQGIQQARHPYLLFTDADCEAGVHWVRHMANGFAQGYEMILGVGQYKPRPGLLNLFVRFETFYTALQYLGWAAWGKAYMGVGRNMGYTREVYEKNGGFSSFQDSLSGDDDLFVNAYAKFHRLGAVTNKEAFTFSDTKSNWKEWFSQKNRHLSASHTYSWESRLRLGLFHLTHMCSYIGTMFALGMGAPLLLTISLLIGRIGISWWMLRRQLRQLGDKETLYTFVALDLFFFLYNLFVIPIGLLKKPSWIK